MHSYVSCFGCRRCFEEPSTRSELMPPIACKVVNHRALAAVQGNTISLSRVAKLISGSNALHFEMGRTTAVPATPAVRLTHLSVTSSGAWEIGAWGVPRAELPPRFLRANREFHREKNAAVECKTCEILVPAVGLEPTA